MRNLLIANVSLLCLMFRFFPACASGSELDGKEWRPFVDGAVRKWSEMFGPVNFRDESMFVCMLYLNPQPKESFRNFQKEQLSKRIVGEHEYWCDAMFKEPFRAAVKAAKPSRYYVNEGRDEAGLLYYTLAFGDAAVAIQENKNVIFLTLKPKDYNPEAGVGHEQLARFLSDWVRLKYKSIDEIIKGFALAKSQKLGDVFTNKDRPRVDEIEDWEDYVTGFIGRDGICLMLFKHHGGRAQLGFPADNCWLNKHLFKEDGVTLVDPRRK